MNIVLEPGASALLDALHRAGFAAYAVGGCVRDTLLGRVPEDWDVTTAARPEQVSALFAGHCIPTGLRHGTVTVRQDGLSVEVTTFRADGPYSDHRRPDTVYFSDSLAEDLARRDLTVNAMAMDVRGDITDLYGGRDDLRRGILRCVGDPDKRFDEDALRIMRTLRFASVLGFTNVDNAGVAGLELKYDDLLTGENGVVLTAVNAWGYTLEQSYETERFPTEGDGLRLTIDSCIQHYLENALSYAVQEHHVAARAVGIVMDVNTGAVLAMSTTPSYDPNEPRVIADTAARNTVEALTGDARKTALQLAQQTQWRNKAVSDLYEPGSVFKLITCAAALDAGAITKHSSFYCGESISVAGTRFHCANHKRHGAQSVTQALENSCNQSFIQIGGRLGRETFCDYFAAFGLREPTGIDLPAEPKKSLYYTADRMGPVELASCAFGQSSKISYLEMAAAVCAVVNGGKLMQPYVVSEILAPDGSTIEQLAPVCKRQVLKAETSQTMREMMEAVVLYGGGRNAQIPGYRVGGKSGTSQKLDSADEKARIASFVAVAPIDDPQFLCLVCLDEPHSWTTAGGSLSAPVCAEVLEQTLVYKGVPRTTEAPAASTAETAADLPADGDSFDGA